MRVLISEYKVSKFIVECLMSFCCLGFVLRNEIFELIGGMCEVSKLFKGLCTKFETMVSEVLYSVCEVSELIKGVCFEV